MTEDELSNTVVSLSTTEFREYAKVLSQIHQVVDYIETLATGYPKIVANVAGELRFSIHPRFGPDIVITK
jgi:hypothetical protein